MVSLLCCEAFLYLTDGKWDRIKILKREKIADKNALIK